MSGIRNFSVMERMWTHFESLIIPKQASAAQRDDMRRAYYAGAQAILQVLIEASNTLNEDAATDLMEAVHNEIQEFLADVLAGRK